MLFLSITTALLSLDENNSKSIQHLSQNCMFTQTSTFVVFHREIFELDNYSPIPVETEEEYKLVVSRFPFHDAEVEKVTCLRTTHFFGGGGGQQLAPFEAMCL